MGVAEAVGERPAAARAAERRRRVLVENLEAWAFLLPALVILLAFHFLPIFYAFFVSLRDWDMISPEKPFVGAANYVGLWSDRDFVLALRNTVTYVVASVPLGIALGLGVALLLNQRLRGIGFFRTAFFVPYVTAVVPAAIVWRWIFHPDQFGYLNYLLTLLGQAPRTWILDPDLAMATVITVAIWGRLGYDVVVYLAGLQNISPDYYEAAQIDGAGPWQTFWRITLPLLSPTTYFLLIISGIGAFKVFVLPLVLTQGGPLKRTTTIVMKLFTDGFQRFEMGYAAAIAFTLFGIIFILTLIQRRLVGRRVHYDV